MINRLVRRAHATAMKKGFYEDAGLLKGVCGRFLKTFSNIKTVKNLLVVKRLALIHEEVSEALRELRKKDYVPEKFAEELADICIRVFDLAGWLGIDLEMAILDKMKKNEDRPHKHDKEF